MKKISPSQQIFIGMALGLVLGLVFPHLAPYLEPLATIFIRLVKTIVVPIIIASLIVGIAGHGDMKAVGRMGLKAIIYFEIITTFALGIGLLAVNLLRPGDGVDITGDREAVVAGKVHSFSQLLVHMFPENVIEAAARGDLLQVVVFTVIFSAALIMIGDRKKPVIDLCESVTEVMFKYTNIVMRFAPIGVGAALAFVVGSKGISVVIHLLGLIACLFLSLAAFLILILIPVMLILRIPVGRFFAAVKEPAVIAFSTTSSEAALPKAMEAMEAFGVPRRVVSFVIPVGYSFNLDGTTLYLPMAAVFVAQAAGVEMSIGQQFFLGLTIMLASKGVAGISRGSMVILAGLLPTFGLPVSAVAVLLSIDAIADMGRTTVNVIGNCLASVVVAKWEGPARSPEAPAVAETTVPAG
ncbi:MAG TPA: cation:dicarboxylase symporter family transporter [Syntrophales bacterium]|jgi:proton glutamate symport protein|nr:cation:dicarboxylase symporter family transporter [Syntrophales bacterium]HON22816.1 cation:dicarboxylase symporter family transporter [Syntrophales bacterium]HOU78838.1 cation:dicarboxylase symporter family transporter [Syntrophales bacterium]HPC31586.1 cation:dicarboxylase symporter family transporter [Syntrophales bacterium]HQG34326.1 cation:dicarboxylase symporter family transporter [Syntrophales bacterium]